MLLYKIRYHLLLLVLCAAGLSFSGCVVHELPVPPEAVAVCLRLNYKTDFPVWEHLIDRTANRESANPLHKGTMRYLVRAYPKSQQPAATDRPLYEYTFTHDLQEGYDRQMQLQLPAGDYTLRVWSDMTASEDDIPFYDATDFSSIALQGVHRGNTDYRDAFRGAADLTVVSDIVERTPDTLEVLMERPLAKFEFITTDVDAFIEKELRLRQAPSDGQTEQPSRSQADSLRLEDYKVEFQYSGFMPDTYSLLTDKPIDSKVGVCFDSSLRRTGTGEASLGFDYVFVNGKESAITVQIGIYDQKGTRLTLSDPITVPLKRSYHTIMKGMFLMSETSGGVVIDPDFDGDYNLIYP